MCAPGSWPSHVATMATELSCRPKCQSRLYPVEIRGPQRRRTQGSLKSPISARRLDSPARTGRMRTTGVCFLSPPTPLPRYQYRECACRKRSAIPEKRSRLAGRPEFLIRTQSTGLASSSPPPASPQRAPPVQISAPTTNGGRNQLSGRLPPVLKRSRYAGSYSPRPRLPR